MRTDPQIIARLASEISQRFSGARVEDVAQTADGRPALVLRRGKSDSVLAADVFAPTPVLTMERPDSIVFSQEHFVRMAGGALRGSVMQAANAIKNERIVEMIFGTRSRFGVPDTYKLIFELVPRFGNVILVKGDTVVAALKEFAGSKNSRRSIRAGNTYVYPPPRPSRGTTSAQETAGSQESVLELFTSVRSQEVKAGPDDAQLREKLAGLLSARRKRFSSEREKIEEQLRKIAQRGAVRSEGESIYASLHTLSKAEQMQAKKKAAAIFDRYKRLTSSEKPLRKRLTEVEARLNELDVLQWELERAEAAHLHEVAAVIGSLREKAGKTRSAPAKRSKPLQYILASGARITAGRSPIQNADITFHLAKPDDLWFHARGQPGAHVILQRDDRRGHSQTDIETAAALAAFHSKGRNSGSVPVDYTKRKYVRKRPASAPGLVFYTNARSVQVKPSEPTKSTA